MVLYWKKIVEQEYNKYYIKEYNNYQVIQLYQIYDSIVK